MPPRRLSRHTFTNGVRLDDQGDERLFLTERVPFRFVELSDNRTHLVREGDSLFSLAGRYFRAFPRPSGLWWIIADFQPVPIHDPTIRLAKGTAVVIPSERTVTERIFNERRRRDS